MNVSYDSIHNFRVHPYMLAFFNSPEQQEIVRASGVRVSIGFDLPPRRGLPPRPRP
ncbi:MAG: hypothetical protein L6V84_04535 [Oscillospiraceae bacterium]|nr:MAG: hypothetical protein L6V84_04535 [Oscillospiraceae bacterium]